jgi:LAO/AO transport system kinase
MTAGAADLGLLPLAYARDKHAVAQLLSVFEDQRPEAIARRAALIEALERDQKRPSARVIGITGTPGSGKSSLLSRLTIEMLARRAELSIAVLAVDPSSFVSGGSLLGDRTRMRMPHGEKRLYFRSQASATELGGLGPASFQVCRLFAHLFDCVFVETVGIGQSEADIRHLAERVYLVLQPLAGDEIQFMKAGIMEVPHAFILNKCDEPSAERSYHTLRGTLGLARPVDGHLVPIHRTSARTGFGIGELVTELLAVVMGESPPSDASKEAYFFTRWVRDEWGRWGLRRLDAVFGGAEQAIASTGGFDRAQATFARRVMDDDDGSA